MQTADAMMQMQTQTMHVHTPIKCSNIFFAIPSQHVTVMNIYSSIYAAVILYIYMVGNCCSSLYLDITGLRQGHGKTLLGSWKSAGIFCNQESGNAV